MGLGVKGVLNNLQIRHFPDYRPLFNIVSSCLVQMDANCVLFPMISRQIHSEKLHVFACALISYLHVSC